MDVVRFGHLGQFIAGSLPLNEFRAWLSNAWCNDLSEAFDGDDELADAVEHALWLFDTGALDESGLRGFLRSSGSESFVGALSSNIRTIFPERRSTLRPVNAWKPREQQFLAKYHAV